MRAATVVIFALLLGLLDPASLATPANSRKVADPRTVAVAEPWPIFFNPMWATDAL